jgi:hypothetical protein
MAAMGKKWQKFAHMGKWIGEKPSQIRPHPHLQGISAQSSAFRLWRSKCLLPKR